jgi:hypothetical protein
MAQQMLSANMRKLVHRVSVSNASAIVRIRGWGVGARRGGPQISSQIFFTDLFHIVLRSVRGTDM